jgi:hypothetical protein
MAAFTVEWSRVKTSPVEGRRERVSILQNRYLELHIPLKDPGSFSLSLSGTVRKRCIPQDDPVNSDQRRTEQSRVG